jgi:holo-[acyl-carrier protein] synthase
MLGCDVVLMSRINTNLADKILTAEEKAEYFSRNNKVEYLAGRWAAKEAVIKATGIKENYTILNAIGGQPYVNGHPDILISISHDGDYAFAVAIRNKECS